MTYSDLILKYHRLIDSPNLTDKEKSVIAEMYNMLIKAHQISFEIKSKDNFSELGDFIKNEIFYE